jgi:hypothetical protein
MRVGQEPNPNQSLLDVVVRYLYVRSSDDCSWRRIILKAGLSGQKHHSDAFPRGQGDSAEEEGMEQCDSLCDRSGR